MQLMGIPPETIRTIEKEWIKSCQGDKEHLDLKGIVKIAEKLSKNTGTCEVNGKNIEYNAFDLISTALKDEKAIESSENGEILKKICSISNELKL